MSQRAKRPNRFDDGTVPVKRRKRTAAQEEEEASALGWRPINDLKIYNRATTEAPAELFRKDLISAMKLPDSEPLASNEYWVICDQWKQEWERGVQVPVNPDSLPEPSVTVTHCATVHIKPPTEYKPPKTRYIRITKDDRFKPEEHYLSTAPAQAEAACSYDLDECDVAWLRLLNAERLAMGLSPISEDQLERVVERYELRCWDRIQAILRNEEGLGIEYDENVICDVCRSPDSEEGNEMVFCDACNICVHQACYGITRIPEGQWLCCTCALKQRPDCVLCPNKGGAMKSTRSGQKWAHVSCALWIPEVSIGCVERMEPITKISGIPASRWALICVLCRERVGACIQCSVKTCKTAYHVTCAFKHGLEMRAIIEDENADDGVKLRSYCEKHSKSGKKEGGRATACSGSEDDDCKRKKRKDMTSEEKNMARAARQAEIEAEFHRHVAVKDVAAACIDVDADALAAIYGYWKLKRRAGHNRPLLPPKYEDVDLLSHKQEQADLERMKMIVQLRQDLERVRNLCYMVSRREKLSRSYFKLRESTFQKQVAVLRCPNLGPKVTDAVVAANRGPSIYDRFYSNADDVTINIESMIARITGCKSPEPDSADERKPEVNGLFKDVKNNPYKKLYFNGASKRRSASLCSSLSSSEESADDKRPPKPRHNKENRLHSSTDDEKPALRKGAPAKSGKAERRRKRFSISRALDSSSEDDAKQARREANTSNSRLKQMEKELVGVSASDSDELMPIKTSSPRSSPNKRAMSSIYSDSDSTDSSARNDASDSQSQGKMRTKAAMKDFSHKQLNKSPNKSSPENKKKTKDDKDKEKDREKEESATKDKDKDKERGKRDAKKKDYVPSDLIVPQRQAAKKATENLKSTTVNRTKEASSDVDAKPEPEKEKDKDKDKEKPPAPAASKPAKKLGRPPKDPKEKELKEQKEREEKERRAKEKENKERLARESKERDRDREKDEKKEDVFDLDRELNKTDPDVLAYVPQRQAAKKAAEHIKGLGNKPPPGADAPDDKKAKDEEKPLEKSPRKEERKRDEKAPAKVADKRKSSTNSSSSSSSSSSSTSSSGSSSSDSESDAPRKKPEKAESATKPADAVAATTTATTTTTATGGRRSGAKDWPFLDKAAKSAASSSSSSDSSDSEGPRAAKGRTASKSPAAAGRTPNKPGRKGAADKKSPAAASEREKQPARPRGRPPGSRGRPRGSPGAAAAAAATAVVVGGATKSESGDRVAANVRHGDIAERAESRTKARKGKSTDVEERASSPVADVPRQRSPPATSVAKQAPAADDSPAGKKDDLLSAVRGDEPEAQVRSPAPASKERDAKDDEPEPEPEPEPTDLEKEIMERKVASNKTSKSKFDRMFLDSKEKDKDKAKEKVSKSPVKENKEPTGAAAPHKQASPNKRSPSKAVKSLDDIFANKLSNSLNAKSPPRDKAPPGAKHEDDIFKIEDDKTRHNYQNAHSNDDLLDDIDDIFDNDFGISSKDEEIMKLPLTFNIAGTMGLREDSKEDSARETLNLVEKLRGNMGLTKKAASIDIDDAISVASSKPEDRVDSDQSVPQVLDEKPDEKDLLSMAPVASQQSQLNLQVAITKVEEKDFKFARADAHTEDKSVPDMQQHTDGATQADERWVPPSEYAPPPFENKPAALLLHDDLSAATAKSQSPPGADRRQPARPIFLDATSSLDCMPSPTPYGDMHSQGKWAESNLMPNRRSSSSSVASSASNMSRRNNDDEEQLLKRHELPAAPGFGHPAMDIINSLPNLLPQPNLLQFPPNALDPAFQQFSNIASQFVGNPVSLFPPASASAQLPFPSPGAAMFPPPFGASYPTPLSVIPQLNKPVEEMNVPQTAAFTSSQHNMALTAALTNAFAAAPKAEEDDDASGAADVVPAAAALNALPEKEELKEEPPIAQAQTPVPVPDASPALSNCTPNHVQPSPNPSVKSNSSSGKKSPSKPTRASARFLSQQQQEKKSPSKSPGKSPRQDLKASSTSKKDKKVGKGSSGRGAQSQNRGRGRGRGRGRPPIAAAHPNEFAFDPNAIHNKLVGTVYDLDFEDDMNECGDLRAMRERRKSSDPHDVRKADSPKFTSPSHKNRYQLSDLRPPTPISDTQSSLSKPASPEPQMEIEKSFPSVVPPVIPGPVDMRTYNSTLESAAYQENSLLTFNSSVAPSADLSAQEHEQELEEFDKELQNSLAKQPEEPAVPEVNKIKVSLSDSRNQLKVKIKGPIANYTASYSSTVTPLPPASDPNANAHALYPNSISNAINSTPVNTNSGVTNLHRMRKKELLRQYCSQGMNTTDPLNSTPGVSAPVTPSLNRTIITIPKAVASMTSIPTKDDYRDYRTGGDEIFETKVRKDKPKSGLRELRQLDLPFGNIMASMDEENSTERRRSIGSNNGTNPSEKRRGRPPRNASAGAPPGQQTAPKLKIKIGANNIVSSANVESLPGLNDGKFDEKRDRIRPPKKRLSASVAKPSVEDYKRESMKFRKQVMADFSEKSEKSERKEKKKKDKDKDKDKSSRKSKKKKKQDLQIVAPVSADATTTKLIIRLRKNDEAPPAVAPPPPPPPIAIPPAEVNKNECARVGDNEHAGERTEGKAGDAAELCASKPADAPAAPCDAADERTSSGDKDRDRPIKLKLARCKEGFKMKAADGGRQQQQQQQPDAPQASPAAPTLNLHEATPPPPPPVHAPTPLPLNKDCEVR